MDTHSSSLLEAALRNIPTRTVKSTIPRIELHVDQGQAGENACQYRAMACFILQGSKRVSFGDKVLHYASGHYLVSALDLPLMGQVYGDANKGPYVALTLVLDPALLNDLILSMPAAQDYEGSELGLSTAPMTQELEDVLARALVLMDRPQDIPVLAPLVERELLYRLLSGPRGKLLRQIASHRRWQRCRSEARPSALKWGSIKTAVECRLFTKLWLVCTRFLQATPSAVADVGKVGSGANWPPTTNDGSWPLAAGYWLASVDSHLSKGINEFTGEVDNAFTAG
ncbi:AraC family transcriptional regulator [Variovorax sp. LjRoot178]|uniref:AraC family transcriptional regulator n=1 Tax=Variovorax sp. LjRoot178 TaxID=3342277 RepID=UPI003ECDE321